jgi:hypothetical protein
VLFGLTKNGAGCAVVVSLTGLAAPVCGAAGVAFTMSASYVFLTVWSFIYLRADLPAGTLRRVTAAVGFVVAVTVVAMALEPWPRTAAAVPAALITALATFLVFVDAPVRARLAKLSGMAASRVRGT